MPRLSIDISEHQHQQLKVIAALNGQTIKDFVLSRAFNDQPGQGDMSEEDALRALQGFLEQRMQDVRAGKTVTRTSADIKARARQLRDGGV